MSRRYSSARRRQRESYQLDDIKALDCFQLFLAIERGKCDLSTRFDIELMAEGTDYDGSPKDYVRFEIFERIVVASRPKRYKYYTTDGICHRVEVRDREDAIQFFHELRMRQDDLVFPDGWDYFGCGYDSAIIFSDVLTWVA